MLRVSLAFVAALGLASCGPRQPVVPPPAPVSGDACEDAEARLRQLGCTEYATTPGGIGFGDACRIAAQDGRSWRPDCIAVVDSCDDVPKAYATPEGSPCH